MKNYNIIRCTSFYYINQFSEILINMKLPNYMKHNIHFNNNLKDRKCIAVQFNKEIIFKKNKFVLTIKKSNVQ